MTTLLTPKALARIFAKSDLSDLPFSDPGNGKPWIDISGSLKSGVGYTPANDSLVVHKTGSETITGPKTLTNTLTIDNRATTANLQFLGNWSVPAFEISSGAGAYLQVTAPYAAENFRFGTSKVSGGPVELNWSDLSKPYLGLAAYGSDPDTKLQRVSAGVAGIYQADGTTFGTLQATRIKLSNSAYQTDLYMQDGRAAALRAPNGYGLYVDGWGQTAIFDLLAGPLSVWATNGLEVKGALGSGWGPITAGAATFSGSVVVSATSGVPFTVNAYTPGFTDQNVYVNSYGTLVSTVLPQAGNVGYAMMQPGDTYARIGLGSNGGIPFIGLGSGTGARDTFLYRYATGPAMQVQAAGGMRVRNLADDAFGDLQAGVSTITANAGYPNLTLVSSGEATLRFDSTLTGAHVWGISHSAGSLYFQHATTRPFGGTIISPLVIAPGGRVAIGYGLTVTQSLIGVNGVWVDSGATIGISNTASNLSIQSGGQQVIRGYGSSGSPQIGGIRLGSITTDQSPYYNNSTVIIRPQLASRSALKLEAYTAQTAALLDVDGAATFSGGITATTGSFSGAGGMASLSIRYGAVSPPFTQDSIVMHYGDGTTGYNNVISNNWSGTQAYQYMMFTLNGGWGTKTPLTLYGDGKVDFASGAEIYIPVLKTGTGNVRYGGAMSSISTTASDGSVPLLALGYYVDGNAYHKFSAGFSGAYSALNFVELAVLDYPTGISTFRNWRFAGDRTLTCPGDVIQTPSASITPSVNGQFVIEATSNTTATIKYKGSDGTVRSVALTLT